MAVVGRPLRRAGAARTTDVAPGVLQWGVAHSYAAADVGQVKAAALHGGRLFLASRKGIGAVATDDGRCGGGRAGRPDGARRGAARRGANCPAARALPATRASGLGQPRLTRPMRRMRAPCGPSLPAPQLL
jgi:hypothetical protein